MRQQKHVADVVCWLAIVALSAHSGPLDIFLPIHPPSLTYRGNTSRYPCVADSAPCMRACPARSRTSSRQVHTAYLCVHSRSVVRAKWPQVLVVSRHPATQNFKCECCDDWLMPFVCLPEAWACEQTSKGYELPTNKKVNMLTFLVYI